MRKQRRKKTNLFCRLALQNIRNTWKEMTCKNKTIAENECKHKVNCVFLPFQFYSVAVLLAEYEC